MLFTHTIQFLCKVNISWRSVHVKYVFR